MSKKFNTAAVCIPSEHYMVNIDDRLKQIKQLVDEGKYLPSTVPDNTEKLPLYVHYTAT